jgi:hypothetical protein
LAIENPASRPVLVDSTHYESFFLQSQDSNPLHRDVAFARRRGFGDRVLYGFALVIEVLETIAEEISTLQVQFVKPIYPNESIFLRPDPGSTLRWSLQDSAGVVRTQIQIETRPKARSDGQWQKQKQDIYALSRKAGEQAGTLILKSRLDWNERFQTEEMKEELYFGGRIREIQWGRASGLFFLQLLQTEDFERSLMEKLTNVLPSLQPSPFWQKQKILVLGGSQGYGLCWGRLAARQGAQVTSISRYPMQFEGDFEPGWQHRYLDLEDANSAGCLKDLAAPANFVIVSAPVGAGKTRWIDDLRQSLSPQAQLLFVSSQYLDHAEAQAETEAAHSLERIKYVNTKQRLEAEIRARFPSKAVWILRLPPLRTRLNAFQTQAGLEDPILVVQQNMLQYEARCLHMS